MFIVSHETGYEIFNTFEEALHYYLNLESQGKSLLVSFNSRWYYITPSPALL